MLTIYKVRVTYLVPSTYEAYTLYIRRIILELTNLKAGRWDEGEARASLKLMQFAAQRLHSIDREESPIFVRMEERLNDGYLFNQDDRGASRSLLLEDSRRLTGHPARGGETSRILSLHGSYVSPCFSPLVA